MADEGAKQSSATGLTHYLRPVNVWALSLGCLLGWGAFVMPGTTLLPAAGPIGAVLALAIAAAIMLVIAANFHFMANRYPDSGGAFAYTKHIFGYDHAFMCGWAILLAYVSIMWANATAFVLIIRYLLGPIFQIGYLYQIAGYDVYAGEILVTLVILGAFGLLSCGKKSLMNGLNTVLAFILFFGTVACLFIVIGAGEGAPGSFEPAFAPSAIPAMGVFSIVALAPWAFIGFESVSHAAGEYRFDQKKTFIILALAVLAGAIIYISTTVISVLGMPSRYDNWVAYLGDLGNLEGIDGLPTFHAMSVAMGRGGVLFLGVVVISALSTSLLGLYRASSRLMYAGAKEEILPPMFSKLSNDGVPRNAILFIMGVSVIVPFVGRAAIGWIVDVTTVSAAIVYGYTSACCFVVGRDNGKRLQQVLGVVGVFVSAVFLVYPLMPNFWSVSPLAPASYLILVAWSILGLVLFRIVFRRDRTGNFGKQTVVWMFLLFIIFFASTMWMRLATNEITEAVVDEVSTYYVEEFESRGVYVDSLDQQKRLEYLEAETGKIRSALMTNSLAQMALLIVSLVLMFSIYSLMLRRERRVDNQRVEAEASSKAKTTFLSNMSHDIRTPMNAIIGYTHLAQREGTSLEEMKRYLVKIDGSSKHLLALINDVLDMSRIESGKMEIELEETDLQRTMSEVRDMFMTQMNEKGVVYTVDAQSVTDSRVMCDGNRLNRVLLNLISNAYKFTPEGGYVTVSLAQVGDAVEVGASEEATTEGAETAKVGESASRTKKRASYELRVKDTGIGMTPEFAEHVFEAFERERSSTVSGIQGTGLGMAITKSIVDMMGGDIRVVTEFGEGTEFVINLDFEVVENKAATASATGGGTTGDDGAVDFTGKRLLLVEDNEINREIATLILEDAGFVLESAENGQVAVDMVSASEPGYYDAVLMDVQMPVMDGYEATRTIRKLDNPELANVIIVAASANAFAEDVQAARDAGMNAHIAKPLDVPKVMDVLAGLLGSN